MSAGEKTNSDGNVLVLRTCNADLTSYGGFKWPESGNVECPDWKPTKECGNGLHGWLWGEGEGSLANWGADAKWLVVRIAKDTVIDLGGKVKFPAGEVIYCGDRNGATEFLAANGGDGRAIIGGTATAGYRGTATAGDGGTATAGYGGVIAIQYWNGKRYKLKIAQVKDKDGDGELKPNKKYRLTDGGDFVEAA